MLRYLSRIPFFTLLLMVFTNQAFADHRDKTPENIAYWHTEGPWVIFKLCVVTAIVMLVIIWLVTRKRKKP